MAAGSRAQAGSAPRRPCLSRQREREKERRREWPQQSHPTNARNEPSAAVNSSSMEGEVASAFVQRDRCRQREREKQAGNQEGLGEFVAPDQVKQCFPDTADHHRDDVNRQEIE